MAKCTGITGEGSRCRAIAITGSDYCHAHHPDRAQARHRAAKKGGKRGGRGRPIAELSALRDENQSLRRRLLEGEILPAVAAVAVQSLNTDIRAVTAVLKAREQEELEERLTELEALLEPPEGGRRWG